MAQCVRALGFELLLLVDRFLVRKAVTFVIRLAKVVGWERLADAQDQALDLILPLQDLVDTAIISPAPQFGVPISQSALPL